MKIGLDHSGFSAVGGIQETFLDKHPSLRPREREQVLIRENVGEGEWERSKDG